MTHNFLSFLFFTAAAFFGFLFFFGQPAEGVAMGDFVLTHDLVAVLGLAAFGAGLALFGYRP